MNTYAENRACASVMERLLRYRGLPVKVRVNPDKNPRAAANQQAQYGLAEIERRLKESQ